jgi:hypothetical protein
MKIWSVIEHIDKGSDEFRLQASFDTAQKALDYIEEHYLKRGWEADLDVEDGDPVYWTYYQDVEDQDMCDEVYIEESEVK